MTDTSWYLIALIFGLVFVIPFALAYAAYLFKGSDSYSVTMLRQFLLWDFAVVLKIKVVRSAVFYTIVFPAKEKSTHWLGPANMD